MSQLQLHGRPWVVFNPANRLHRKFYYEFVKSGTWGRCPYRFMVADDQGDVITMIQRSLIKYYVEREFNVAKKQQSMLQKNNKQSPPKIIKKTGRPEIAHFV
jgi:hypothetical protein